jgi:putative Holliday junction resolvase
MRYLALDVGERRVGVAVSDQSALIATPLTVIHRKSKVDDFRRIARLLVEHGANGLIVGQPLNADGSAGQQAARVKRYALALAQSLRDEGIEVTMTFWDEYLSTQRAQQAMIAAGRGSKQRRMRIDAAAAAVILQDFLDVQRTNLLPTTEEVH